MLFGDPGAFLEAGPERQNRSDDFGSDKRVVGLPLVSLGFQRVLEPGLQAGPRIVGGFVGEIISVGIAFSKGGVRSGQGRATVPTFRNRLGLEITPIVVSDVSLF